MPGAQEGIAQTIAEKPPTQYAGVVGIEPKPIVLTPEPARHVDWGALASLPPFQMYAVERCGRADTDSHAWAFDFAQREAAQVGDEALMASYVEWHTAKGYWPNETPFGVAL